MPIVKACQKELAKAYRKHVLIYDSFVAPTINEPTAKLVLFYAIECALKSAYLLRNKLPTTVEPPLSMMSHDLGEVLKDLKAPFKLTSALLTQFRSADGSKNYPAKEMHLAWRYGVGVHAEDDAAFVQNLKSLREYVKEELA